MVLFIDVGVLMGYETCFLRIWFPVYVCVLEDFYSSVFTCWLKEFTVCSSFVVVNVCLVFNFSRTLFFICTM